MFTPAGRHEALVFLEYADSMTTVKKAYLRWKIPVNVEGVSFSRVLNL